MDYVMIASPVEYKSPNESILFLSNIGNLNMILKFEGICLFKRHIFFLRNSKVMRFSIIKTIFFHFPCTHWHFSLTMSIGYGFNCKWNTGFQTVFVVFDCVSFIEKCFVFHGFESMCEIICMCLRIRWIEFKRLVVMCSPLKWHIFGSIPVWEKKFYVLFFRGLSIYTLFNWRFFTWDMFKKSICGHVKMQNIATFCASFG